MSSMRVVSIQVPQIGFWAAVTFVLASASTYVYGAGVYTIVEKPIAWALGVLGAVAAAVVGIEVGAKAKHASDVYRVWFGTNRTELPRSRECFLATDDGVIHYGYCDVRIPESHEFGSTGSGAASRMVKRVFRGKCDDRLVVSKLETLEEDMFFSLIQKNLPMQDPDDERTVLIYIHGYNVAFLEAAIRAAQMGFDLGVPGITAFYSWPSKGTVEGYLADEDAIAASEPLIAQFLIGMATRTQASKVNIIAHSMGNRGLLRAMTAATTQAALQGVRFGQIILAAPDIDVHLFKNLAAVYPTISERTTLYVSAKDQAVRISGALHANERTGYCPPVTIVKGIDTIEVTNIDLDILGHGYFSNAADVLSDMYTLLRYNNPPGRRFRLRPVDNPDGTKYWSFAN